MVLLIVALLYAAPADARSSAAVREFRAQNICPATGVISKRCAGYVVDHIVPLCLGGEDSPRNMQYQEKVESLDKDKVEVKLCAYVRRAQFPYAPKPRKGGM